MPEIKHSALPVLQRKQHNSINSVRKSKKLWNEQSYLEPTKGFIAKIKKPLELSDDIGGEEISIDRLISMNLMSGLVGGPKMLAPIASVVMGDF